MAAQQTFGTKKIGSVVYRRIVERIGACNCTFVTGKASILWVDQMLVREVVNGGFGDSERGVCEQTM